MRPAIALPVLALCLTALSACQRAADAPPPVKLAEPQRAVLDKAKGVEQQLQQDAQAKEQTIQKSAGE